MSSLTPHMIADRETRHRRRVTGALLVGVAAFMVALGQSHLMPHSGTLSAQVLPSQVSVSTNAAREQHDRVDLVESPLLAAAAQAKAADMARRGYFAHETPDGRTPWTFLDEAGYPYTAAGENLAVHFLDAGAVVDAWMHSPEHRANILDARFREIGVGTAVGEFAGQRAVFVVQFLAAPETPTVSTAPATPPSQMAAARTAVTGAVNNIARQLLRPNVWLGVLYLLIGLAIVGALVWGIVRMRMHDPVTVAYGVAAVGILGTLLQVEYFVSSSGIIG